MPRKHRFSGKLARNRKRLKRRLHKKKPRFQISASRIKYIGGLQAPLPPAYYTKFTTRNTTVFAAGSLTTTYGTVDGNALRYPFDSSFPGFYNSAVPVNTTQMPAGYTQLCNGNLYNVYRVMSSKIEVTVRQGSAADIIECLVIPSNTDLHTFTVQQLMSQQYASLRDSTQSRGISQKRYMSTGTIFSRKNSQILADDVYAANHTTSPNQLWIWYVFFNVISGLNAGSIVVETKITHYAQLEGLQIGVLAQS